MSVNVSSASSTSARIAPGLAFALVAGAAAAESELYRLDPEHTSVAFLVEHVGFAKVVGRFDEVAGSFMYDPETGSVSELRVTVATDSVDTGNEARDAHLLKADFLDVGNHPEMVFEAEATVSEATASEGGPLATGTLEGTLQLLHETRPFALDYTLNKAADYPFGDAGFTLGVSLRGALSRSDWGMDYGVANGLVGDAVELLIETEANRR